MALLIRSSIKPRQLSVYRFIILSSPSLQTRNFETCDDISVYNPNYRVKPHESIELKKSRLLYQSRKRGMLENGLLLSTFAAKYLEKMNDVELNEYDKLINLPSNDWDIYHWAVGAKPTPDEFNTSVMNKFKNHVKNLDREVRIAQPPLY